MGDTAAQQNANLGTWGNMYRSVTTTYTVALLDKGWTVSAAGAASYTISLTAASGYDPNFQAVIVNADPSNDKTVAPNGVSSFTLKPRQPLLVFNNNNAWIAGALLTSSMNSAIAALSGAWVDYTPSVVAGIGAFTTVSATGRFLQMGKTIFLKTIVTITTNGTASSFIIVGLPVNSNGRGSGCGLEVAVNGKAVMANILAASSTMNLLLYDGTYPGGSGFVIVTSAVYESV